MVLASENWFSENLRFCAADLENENKLLASSVCAASGGKRAASTKPKFSRRTASCVRMRGPGPRRSVFFRSTWAERRRMRVGTHGSLLLEDQPGNAGLTVTSSTSPKSHVYF